MNTYLKTKFPEIMEPEMDGPYKYRWEVSFGSMLGRRIEICLTDLGPNTTVNGKNIWIINAIREIICEGRIIDTSRFIYSCSAFDDLGKLMLDKIGDWLSSFTDYKKIDDEQLHNGDISKVNYKIICGEI